MEVEDVEKVPVTIEEAVPDGNIMKVSLKLVNFNQNLIFFLESLSKNQRKKLLRRKKMLEIRQDIRQRHREKKKLKKILEKEQGIVSTKPTRKQLQKNKVDPEKSKISIAVDLSFDDLMVEKDLSSCASQLMRIYTANRRSTVPIPIHFTSLKEGSPMYQQMTKIGGFHSWDIKIHEKSYLELFDKEKIVYLTSESDNVLDVLEEGVCYIIGGLVDHNKKKGLTHGLATKEGIRTAKLPLTENLIIKTRQVLTVNHVGEIMINVSNGKSWKEVFKEILPARKGFIVKEEEEVVKENEEEAKNYDNKVVTLET